MFGCLRSFLPTATSLYTPLYTPLSPYQWQATGHDQSSVQANPELVDPNGPDYWDLQPSSPALANGFIPISVSGGDALACVQVWLLIPMRVRSSMSASCPPPHRREPLTPAR